MRNPFRTEAEAFRFVWLTIIYFALIVVALGDQHVARASACSSARRRSLVWWLFTRGLREDAVPQAPPAHADGEHRILVVANETVGGEELLDGDQAPAEGVRAQVLVVCPR